MSEASGSVTLEWLLVLPLVALAVAGVLETGAVVRDALLLQDAARVGVRVAATTHLDAEIGAAVSDVLADAEVGVRPARRSAGDLVHVTVSLDRRVGPVSHRLTATAVARAEPVVGHGRRPGPGP